MMAKKCVDRTDGRTGESLEGSIGSLGPIGGGGGACEKRLSFSSAFPMFVPSLSWQNDHF
jgi:hypothetical protein